MALRGHRLDDTESTLDDKTRYGVRNSYREAISVLRPLFRNLQAVDFSQTLQISRNVQTKSTQRGVKDDA